MSLMDQIMTQTGYPVAVEDGLIGKGEALAF